MLREAGVEVVTGVMEEEARALNKAFMTLQTKGRPYIILKWAQSEDGFIDRLRTDVSEPVTVLSSPETSRLVHNFARRWWLSWSVHGPLYWIILH